MMSSLDELTMRFDPRFEFHFRYSTGKVVFVVGEDEIILYKYIRIYLYIIIAVFRFCDQAKYLTLVSCRGYTPEFPYFSF